MNDLTKMKIRMVLIAPIVYPAAVGAVLVRLAKNVWTDIVDSGYSMVVTVRDVNRCYKTKFAMTSIPKEDPETVW